MREPNEYEITVEKLLNVVHSYTDPIRISVVMGDAWLSCGEAKHMHGFFLTECLTNDNNEERERLLKYYKDVPVWNLVVWTDGTYSSKRGRALYMGIEAHCHYKDIREGFLAEREDIRRQKRREYRKRKRAEREEE